MSDIGNIVIDQFADVGVHTIALDFGISFQSSNGWF